MPKESKNVTAVRAVWIQEDYSGSGRVTNVMIGTISHWTWTWHIDGNPAPETVSLLKALGWKE